MTWSVDARVPVLLGVVDDLGQGDAVLAEAGLPVPSGYAIEAFAAEREGHAAGCACCVARSPAGVALDRLFQRRARGEVRFFRRVVALTATPGGDMAVWTALRTDPVAAARFRPVDAS